MPQARIGWHVERQGEHSVVTRPAQPSPDADRAARILYVSDVDHTLLGSDGTLSRYSRDTLNNLLAAGLQFTVASARSCSSLRHLLAGLHLTLPVVDFNGSFVSDLATGHHHVVHAVAPALLGDLWTLVQRSGHVPFVSTWDGRADRLYYDTVINAGMQWYLDDRESLGDPRLRRLANLRDGLREQVVCFTVIGLQEPLDALREEIHQRHSDAVRTYCFENTYSPGWYWLTVHAAAASKERGVAALIRRRPDLHGCRLVVFGDGDNDIGLFQAADTALAVANATAALKRHATTTIPANDDDAVARWLATHAAAGVTPKRR